MKKGERTTRYGVPRAAAAKCRMGCSNCWSFYNVRPLVILHMQCPLHTLLETV
jgi:hypothetical protein